MRVAMVNIWEMPVTVDHGPMAMSVQMRLARWVRRTVRMAMVLVMQMGMLMLHRFVAVFVLMLFGQMEIKADRHQDAGKGKLQREGLTQQNDRKKSAEEGCDGVVGAGACRADLA